MQALAADEDEGHCVWQIVVVWSRSRRRIFFKEIWRLFAASDVAQRAFWCDSRMRATSKTWQNEKVSFILFFLGADECVIFASR